MAEASEEVSAASDASEVSRPFAVSTHHKCASNWLVDYCRAFAALNDLTIDVTHESGRFGTADIFVNINADYDVVHANGAEGLHLLRNPLDIIVSAYHSHLKSHPLNADWAQLPIQRHLLRSVAQADGMMLTLAFLERADFGPKTIGPLLGLRRWRYDDPLQSNIRMEDAVRDVGSSIGVLLQDRFGWDMRLPDAKDFVFEKYSAGRAPGSVSETSHYRSGRLGQWRTELPSAAVSYVRAHLREVLERYYPDSL